VNKTPAMTVHLDNLHLMGKGEDHWNKPNGTHSYRGMGQSGRRKIHWSRCDVCDKRRGHRQHGQPFRTCSYCGSIHLDDLLDLHGKEIWYGKESSFSPIEWADQKYGWPHKLYMDAGPGLHIKFYSIHLQDHPKQIYAFNKHFGYLGVTFYIGESDKLAFHQRKVST